MTATHDVDLDRHHGHFDTELFGTVSIRERGRAPLTEGEPELVIFTDTVLEDPYNLVRHLTVVDGRGRGWKLLLPVDDDDEAVIR